MPAGTPTPLPILASPPAAKGVYGDIDAMVAPTHPKTYYAPPIANSGAGLNKSPLSTGTVYHPVTLLNGWGANAHIGDYETTNTSPTYTPGLLAAGSQYAQTAPDGTTWLWSISGNVITGVPTSFNNRHYTFMYSSPLGDVYHKTSGGHCGAFNCDYIVVDSTGHITFMSTPPAPAHSWTTYSGTTAPYTNPSAAYDGDLNTCAYASFWYSHVYAGCVWTFNNYTPPNGTISKAVLKIVSSAVATATFSGRVDLSYSLDNGATWNSIYSLTSATQTARTDTVNLSTTQDFTQVQVMAFIDSDENGTHNIYEIELDVTYATAAQQAANQTLTAAAVNNHPTRLSLRPIITTGQVFPTGTGNEGRVITPLTLSPVLQYTINSGGTGTGVGPTLLAPRSGAFTVAKIMVTGMDANVDLTFVIKKNGTGIFTGNVSHTYAGSYPILYTLASSSFVVNDSFTIDILSGSTNWVFTVILE